MLDSATISHQRSHGVARVAIGRDGRVAELFQQGSAKAMLPATHDAVPEVVFLNTSGGLTGGDRLRLELIVGDGARVTAATQTAERVYASGGGAAKARVRIDVGAGAFCAWLPQETILFDTGALERSTEVSLGAGAGFLGIETLVLGRQAMGERVDLLTLSDTRRVRGANGRLLHAEQVGIDGAVLARRGDRAGLADARVVSSLVYLAEDAGDRLAAVRAALAGTDAAASAWGGRLVIRMLGADSWNVRLVMARAIAALGSAVPRVWQM